MRDILITEPEYCLVCKHACVTNISKKKGICGISDHLLNIALDIGEKPEDCPYVEYAKKIIETEKKSTCSTCINLESKDPKKSNIFAWCPIKQIGFLVGISSTCDMSCHSYVKDIYIEAKIRGLVYKEVEKNEQ